MKTTKSEYKNVLGKVGAPVGNSNRRVPDNLRKDNKIVIYTTKEKLDAWKLKAQQREITPSRYINLIMEREIGK